MLLASITNPYLTRQQLQTFAQFATALHAVNDLYELLSLKNKNKHLPTDSAARFPLYLH